MEPAPGVRRPKQALASLNPKREWWRMALLRNTEIIEPDTDPSALTARYTDEAIRFIRQNQAAPVLPLPGAHLPACAVVRFGEVPTGRAAAGCMATPSRRLDWSVGQVLETLRRGETRDEHVCLLRQ